MNSAKKGLLLLGGSGTRLRPVTTFINKHMLPVFDKPMFFYPLSVLLLAGARKISVITSPQERENYQRAIRLLNLDGVEFVFFEQQQPKGIVDAMLEAAAELRGSPFWMALGDNLLFGPGLGRSLSEGATSRGCQIYTVKSKSPERFGSVKFNDDGTPVEIREKADSDFSNDVIPGLYYFPENTMDLAQNVEPSSRGEREVTSLLDHFVRLSGLSVRRLPRGTNWIDMGTAEDLHSASTLVKLYQEYSGQFIGVPEEALHASNQWISQTAR